MKQLVIPKGILHTLSPVIHYFLYDASGSMEKYKKAMAKGIGKRKQELLNQDEVNSIIIGRMDFSGQGLRVYEFTSVKDMNTSYDADGGTPLYEAISVFQQLFCNGKDGTIDILTDKGYAPRPYLWIWSDGEDTNGGLEQAQASIEILHNNGVTVSMVLFGQKKELGIKIGIKEGNIFSCENSEEDLEKANAAVTQSSVVASRSSMQITSNIFDND